MAYSTALKNALIDVYTGFFNSGSGAGKIAIGTTGMASTLVTITLNDPAFAAADAGEALMDVDPAVAAEIANSGTAAEAQFMNSDDTVFDSGITVGEAATDIVVDDAALVDGGTFSITSYSITI